MLRKTFKDDKIKHIIEPSSTYTRNSIFTSYIKANNTDRKFTIVCS